MNNNITTDIFPWLQQHLLNFSKFLQRGYNSGDDRKQQSENHADQDAGQNKIIRIMLSIINTFI